MNKGHCTSVANGLLTKRLFLSWISAPSPVPRRLAAVIGVACALCWSAAARAEFKGTPGKVASIGPAEQHCPLRIWEPGPSGIGGAAGTERVVDPKTWSLNTSDSATNGFPSAPAWSPDGTMLAYTKESEDAVINGVHFHHTSIFIYRLNSSGGLAIQPLTQPTQKTDCFEGNPPKADCHSEADWAPAWSPDGKVVYFIRHVVAGPDSKLYPQRGQNVWSVAVTGGAESQVTEYTDDGDGIRVESVVAVPGIPNLIVGRILFGKGMDLAMWDGHSAAPFVSNELISDFDVAPDGSAVVWSEGVQMYMKPLKEGGPGETTDLGASSAAAVRFANDGSGVLHTGTSSRGLAGLLERLIRDPNADIAENETDRFALEWTSFGTTFRLPGVAGRSGFDVQPQTLPIIFVPGFLGTTIMCGDRRLWPQLGPGNAADLVAMSLDHFGSMNTGCRGAGPAEIVETAGWGPAQIDLYRYPEMFLNYTFPDGRVTLFGWDWRKSALASELPLHDAVDRALASDGPWKDQDAQRVVLIGHSFGGLLINSYLKGGISEGEPPNRVARTLTLGTPYWGAPKAIFPLAFGIETPVSSALDWLLNNDGLRALAINLAGLYELYPSAPFGPWLTVDSDAPAAGRGVAHFVEQIGGNVDLLDQAQDFHDQIYDGFYDNTGRIDVRAVIGTGFQTIGDVKIRTGTPQGGSVEFIDGDKTVPTRSGAQGGPGAAPMGDPIHRQYTCGVEHLELPNDMRVLKAYKDFLDTGAVPRRLSGPVAGPCPARGDTFKFTGELNVAPQAPTGLQAPMGLHGAAESTPVVGLDEAQTRELAQVLRLPNQTVVATDIRKPLTLRLQITDGSLTWQSHDGDVVGAAHVYGPLTGTLEITPSADRSALPLVTINGTPVSPQTPSHGSDGGCSGNGGCNAADGSPGAVVLAIVGLLRRRRARRTASQRE